MSLERPGESSHLLRPREWLRLLATFAAFALPPLCPTRLASCAAADRAAAATERAASCAAVPAASTAKSKMDPCRCCGKDVTRGERARMMGRRGRRVRRMRRFACVDVEGMGALCAVCRERRR
eukprot:4629151-Prymnesium_polylepis.2